MLPPSSRADNAATDDADAEPEDLVKVLETQGKFDDMIVWGHEILPAADDTFVKGLEEWVSFAETVCTTCVLLLIILLELTRSGIRCTHHQVPLLRARCDRGLL